MEIRHIIFSFSRIWKLSQLWMHLDLAEKLQTLLYYDFFGKQADRYMVFKNVLVIFLYKSSFKDHSSLSLIFLDFASTVLQFFRWYIWSIKPQLPCFWQNSQRFFNYFVNFLIARQLLQDICLFIEQTPTLLSTLKCTPMSSRSLQWNSGFESTVLWSGNAIYISTIAMLKKSDFNISAMQNFVKNTNVLVFFFLYPKLFTIDSPAVRLTVKFHIYIVDIMFIR